MARAVVAQTRKKFIRDGEKLEDWGTVTVADALADRQRVFRCLECRAPVRPHKASPDQDATSSTAASSRAARGAQPVTVPDGRMLPPWRS